MNVTQIFCDADDFCQGFIPDWEQRQLEPDEKTKTRARARSVCESEIITLVVCYHKTGCTKSGATYFVTPMWLHSV